MMTKRSRVSRRIFLGGGIGVAGLASNLLALSADSKGAYASSAISNMLDITDISNNASAIAASFAGLPFMGTIDPKVNGFDPMAILTAFDVGKVSKLPSGQTLREYTFTAINKTILVAPDKPFAALAYNGLVPGPTLRATQGDHIRITFINRSDTAHSMHFNGIHAGSVDGLIESVAPGTQMVYEFDAQPFGLHLYQGFTLPLTTHMFKGLYGTFIVDPPQPRPQALELFMTLNGFVLASDGQNAKPGSSSATASSSKLSQDANNGPPDSNNVYAVNTVAYHFIKNPIAIPVNKLVRVYLVNVTEFDALNSFHVHGTLLNIYRTGTSLQPDETNNTIMLAPGQRAILEFSFKTAGQYMFHAYQGEYADLGYMGIFDVK